MPHRCKELWRVNWLILKLEQMYIWSKDYLKLKRIDKKPNYVAEDSIQATETGVRFKLHAN